MSVFGQDEEGQTKALTSSSNIIQAAVECPHEAMGIAAYRWSRKQSCKMFLKKRVATTKTTGNYLFGIWGKGSILSKAGKTGEWGDEGGTERLWSLYRTPSSMTKVLGGVVGSNAASTGSSLIPNGRSRSP